MYCFSHWGILLNLYGLYPSYLEQLDLSFYALCALMFCVGITVGNNPQILLNFKTVNPRFFLLPVLTILGTLVGCCMSSVFFNKHSPVDCMAVGAGFGYYSLSSIIITEYKGAELGDYSPAIQYNERDYSFTGSTFSGSFLWKIGTYRSRRGYDNGYYSSYYNSLFRRKIYSCIYCPWVFTGFFRTIHCNVIVYHLTIIH